MILTVLQFKKQQQQNNCHHLHTEINPSSNQSIKIKVQFNFTKSNSIFKTQTIHTNKPKQKRKKKIIIMTQRFTNYWNVFTTKYKMSFLAMIALKCLFYAEWSLTHCSDVFFLSDFTSWWFFGSLLSALIFSSYFLLLSSQVSVWAILAALFSFLIPVDSFFGCTVIGIIVKCPPWFHLHHPGNVSVWTKAVNIHLHWWAAELLYNYWVYFQRSFMHYKLTTFKGIFLQKLSYDILISNCSKLLLVSVAHKGRYCTLKICFSGKAAIDFHRVCSYMNVSVSFSSEYLFFLYLWSTKKINYNKLLERE